VGEYTGRDGKDGERSPPPFENGACHKEERKEEQPVREYPAGVERLREQDVTHRFVDQVGEDGPEGGETDEPPVAGAPRDRKAEDETEQEVAGDEHPS